MPSGIHPADLLIVSCNLRNEAANLINEEDVMLIKFFNGSAEPQNNMCSADVWEASADVPNVC